MSIGSIGSTPSFWQQDQSYWQQAQENDNSTAATDSVINAIGSAETSLGKGLASIANQTALSHVNSQLSAAIQSILDGNTGSSSSSSSGASSSSSSKSSPSPATGTGSVALSTSTPLSLLGILAGGRITISAGKNTTTYTSTGTDTVGDLMNAIDANDFGNAAVTASLSRHGRLVLTSKNDTDTITVRGVYASNIGFAVGNQTFTPTKGTSFSSTASSGAGTSTPAANAASSSSHGTPTTANTKTSYSTVASEMLSSAASLLSDSGDGGTLVDMLA
jgi:hypothetical protein